MRLAVELARDEVNAAGGVKGAHSMSFLKMESAGWQGGGECREQTSTSTRSPRLSAGVLVRKRWRLRRLPRKQKFRSFSAASTNPKITTAGGVHVSVRAV